MRARQAADGPAAAARAAPPTTGTEAVRGARFPEGAAVVSATGGTAGAEGTGRTRGIAVAEGASLAGGTAGAEGARGIAGAGHPGTVT